MNACLGVGSGTSATGVRPGNCVSLCVPTLLGKASSGPGLWGVQTNSGPRGNNGRVNTCSCAR